MLYKQFAVHIGHLLHTVLTRFNQKCSCTEYLAALVWQNPSFCFHRHHSSASSCLTFLFYCSLALLLLQVEVLPAHCEVVVLKYRLPSSMGTAPVLSGPFFLAMRC